MQKTKNIANLKISEVAIIAGCHRNTIYNYEKRGFLKPVRDIFGYRRYSFQDAMKLKGLFDARWGTGKQALKVNDG